MRSRRGYPYAFLAPYAVFLVAFGLIPTAYGLYLSFTSRGFATQPGLFGNYLALFKDLHFLPALLNVLKFLAIFVPLMVVGVTALALILHARASKYSSFARFAYFLPGALTGTVAVLLWLFMLDPTLSPFSALLHQMGFETRADVLRTGHLPWIFALMMFTTGVGSWILIFHGAMQSISDDVMEAARSDGCNSWQLAVYIKLPLIKKYVIYLFVLAYAAGVQIFTEPQLLRLAVPPSIDPSWSLNQLSFQYSFALGEFGTSAAISILLLVLGLVGAIFLVWRTDLFEERVT